MVDTFSNYWISLISNNQIADRNLLADASINQNQNYLAQFTRG